MLKERINISLKERPQSRDIVVLKFGGTSVSQPEKVLEIIDMYARQGSRVIVVLSAASQVTNNLVNVCTALKTQNRVEYQNSLMSVLNLNIELLERLGVTADRPTVQFEKFHQYFGDLGRVLSTFYRAQDEAKFIDAVSSFGERFSQIILTQAAIHRGLNAVSVDALTIVKTDNSFGSAKPNFEAIEIEANSVINPLLSQGKIPIIAGFIGSTTEGEVTTLGRGGSDYSATILGGALNCREVVIFTDVDGIYNKDPNKHKDAVRYKTLSKYEADCMAKAGAKVLYPNTLDPLMDKNTIVVVRNTSNLGCPGTKIY